MSTKSFTVNVNSGDVKTSLGSNTGYQQVQIGTGRCFTATLLENWVATADTKNDGTAILWAKGHDVDLTLAKGSNGWRVTNDGNDHGVHFTGSSKNDTLVGGAGMDILDGGAGDDLLAGGKGSDIFCCNGGNDTITDLGRGGDALTVNTSGRVTAYLAENWTANQHSNNDGNVTLIAQGHDVTLSEILYGSKGWTITNAGNKTGINFVGSLNNDTLVGGAGADVLNGGKGNDWLVGGDGADTFEFDTSGWGNDVIVDFHQGTDHLNFIGSTLSAADVKEYHDGLNTVLKYGSSFITLVGVQDVHPTADIWINH